jgi:hypothetical protein
LKKPGFSSPAQTIANSLGCRSLTWTIEYEVSIAKNHHAAKDEEMPSSKTTNLIQVKQKLAAKYRHLANLTKSPAQRKKFTSRAERYRRQVLQLQHD